MRILVHDYSGHPFQVQLTRALAARGHEALHLHCPSFSTGKGALERTAVDPPTFDIDGVSLGAPFAKYSPRRRLAQELRYGRLLAVRARAFEPDVILSSNTPLFAQHTFVRHIRDMGASFIFWQQDIYSVAMRTHAVKKLGPLGSVVGRAFLRLERSMTMRSDAVVAISEGFVPVLREWGIAPERCHVVENWAPLDELPMRPPDNEWARQHGLTEKFVLLYSGTLGLKHNPDLLLRLAQNFADRDNTCVVVISEGPGADWLRERAGMLDNLLVLDYQPYSVLPDVFASADGLVVILEAEAGVFSVPSKVLSYHCAGRPILAAVPEENLAARIIAEHQTGITTHPDDIDGLLKAAEELFEDHSLRAELGRNARAYAERTFDIETITDRFEDIISECRVDGRLRLNRGRVGL